jgi:hypothetical protein
MPPPEAAYLASKIFRQNHMQRSCIWSLPGDKAAFVAPVSASKNSVPDSDFRDRFDDWVVGRQFVPDYLL